MSGAGGASAGTSGAGGASAGTSGAGGASGSSPVATENIGNACSSDTDCGTGGKCLTADTDSLGDGGPAHGYCTVDCTADSSACGAKATCTTLSPAESLCLLSCKFGTPPLQYLDDLDGASPPNKCRGRKDTACRGLFNDNGDYVGQDACFPMCNADSNCPPGRACDLENGRCVAASKLAGKKKANDLCNAAATEDECAGICVRLYAKGDPNTPAGKEDLGVCLDTCTIGTIEGGSCGGIDSGLCLLTELFTPVAGGPAGGPADLGACIPASTAGDSCSCHWQEGQWSVAFPALNQSYCFFLGRDACASDKDCAFACSTDFDCQDSADPGRKCDKSSPNPNGSGQCKKKNGTYATLFDNVACLPVGPNGEKMCAPKDAADVSLCGGSKGN